MPRKKSSKSNDKPLVNKDLEGFKLNINKFGELESSFDLDKLNAFLDKNVEDKKITNRKKDTKKNTK